MDKICCICGAKIDGWGNNSYPVKEEGECCDNCNNLFVIPARIYNMYHKEGGEDEVRK